MTDRSAHTTSDIDRDFDLLLTRAGERYKAIVVDAPAGEARLRFDLPKEAL